MHLSDNFTQAEAERSMLAARRGIDNTAPAIVIPALQFVARTVLEPARAQFGVPFSPSSWYRCLDLNRALGSSDRSQHIKGEAVDFEIPGVSNFELADWLRGAIEFDQLILECYTPGKPASGWVHVSAFDEMNAGRPMRGEVLTYVPGTGYLKGLVA